MDGSTNKASPPVSLGWHYRQEVHLCMYKYYTYSIRTPSLKSFNFLFKNTSEYTFLGFKELRGLLTVSPATEKILSDGVEVAAIFSKHLAILVWKSFFIFPPPGQWVCLQSFQLNTTPVPQW